MTRLEIARIVVVAVVLIGTPTGVFGYRNYLRSQNVAEATLVAPCTKSTAPGSSGDAAAAGKQVFERMGCASCHGADAEGGVGPALTSVGAAEIRSAVRIGRGMIPSTGVDLACSSDVAKLESALRRGEGTMPAFGPDKITEEQIEQLVDYVLTFSKK